MSVPVHREPIVTTVSIDVFSSFTMNIKNERDPSRAYRTQDHGKSLWGW
jgi:hypothetical protein